MAKPPGVLRVRGKRTEIEPLAAGWRRGEQLLQEAGKPHGEQMGAGPGDGQSPRASRAGAARNPGVRAPPPLRYLIPAPPIQGRDGACADSTTTPSKDQQPAWLPPPRRGAVCRVTG